MSASRTAAPARGSRHWPKRLLGAALLATAVAAGLALTLEAVAIPPRLLGPYLERRSLGHAPWIESIGRALNLLLNRLDRGPLQPRLQLPGWTAVATRNATSGEARSKERKIAVASEAALVETLEGALPGDEITLAPGRYHFSGRALTIARAGTPIAPITVRGPARGTVLLEFSMLEGFHVLAPHWIFENLSIRGTCASHDDCEHAFHIVGDGTDVVIRNNELQDFNAHIKINGQGGRFPDRGRITRNTLINHSARATGRPVTPIDIVAASDWRIEGNLIVDFVKQGGDQTSYGAFAKGAGRGTRFERNIVLCEHRLRGAAGRRVGLSFGGGGSGAAACRDGRCEHEHRDGAIVNNLIASCSDEGIYLNRAERSRIAFNTLIDTAGISARFVETDASLTGNWVDGAIRRRQGARISDEENRTTALALLYLGRHPLREWFESSADLDLRWQRQPLRVVGDVAAPLFDLCGAPRPARPAYGAIESIAECQR